MLIDFDALYNDFVKKWSRENAARLSGGDPLNFIGEIYQSWLDTPIEQTGGLSPRQYFGNLSGKEAADMLARYDGQNIPVPSPLIDRLAQKSEEAHIIKLLKDSRGERLVKLCADILEEMGSEAHVPAMAEILLSGGDAEIKSFAAAILSSHAEKAKDILLPKITFNLDENDMYIADVLVYCKGEDKVYKLLEKLFLSGKNNVLYASYLGMYEDLRALPLLRERIKNPHIGYVEFTEIRNSIERLGGEVDVKRDFSSDPDYAVLKNKV